MNDDQVLRIDVRNGRIIERADVPGSPLDPDVDDGTAWVPASRTGVLWTIDVASDERERGPTLGTGIFVAQVLAGSVWVLNFSGDEVYRLSTELVRWMALR